MRRNTQSWKESEHDRRFSLLRRAQGSIPGQAPMRDTLGPACSPHKAHSDQTSSSLGSAGPGAWAEVLSAQVRPDGHLTNRCGDAWCVGPGTKPDVPRDPRALWPLDRWPHRLPSVWNNQGPQPCPWSQLTSTLKILKTTDHRTVSSDQD